MAGKHELQEIPIFDLNFSAFLMLNGINPGFVQQGNKIICLFTPDDKFYRFSALYYSNAPVKILDFVKSLRQLRSKVMVLRSENGGGVSTEK